jgi:hypothetical protein
MPGSLDKIIRKADSSEDTAQNKKAASAALSWISVRKIS